MKLNIVLSTYIREENKEYAKKKGAKQYGSIACYIDTLISKDRGIPPIHGHWSISRKKFNK